MIFQLSYTSPSGDTLDLANNPDFILKDIDGMTAANVELATSSVAVIDGDTVTNTRTYARPITLYLEIAQNLTVEDVKREILSVIKPKQTGTLYYAHNGRTLTIQGTVETIELPRFTNRATMQITFYCAAPYWRDADLIIDEITNVIALHHFELIITEDNPIVFGYYNTDLTREIINDGDAAIGMEIVIIATGSITNPKIERADGTFFGLNVTMEMNDEIIIVTEKGKKSVQKNGQNILSAVMAGSTWLQLETGSNIFTISEAGGSGEMIFSIQYRRAFV